MNTIRVSNGLDPDQDRHFVGPDLGQDRHFVGPDLGPTRLQRLSTDDTRKHSSIYCECRRGTFSYYFRFVCLFCYFTSQSTAIVMGGGQFT